jgi:hypothetical protein
MPRLRYAVAVAGILARLAGVALAAALAAGVASAAPARAARDVSAPRAHALPSFGQAGGIVRLRVLAADDSGEFRLGASVFRGTTNLLTVRSPFLEVVPRPRYYFVQFSRPPLPAGAYRFCAKAFDRAGNASGITCASLVVR